MKSEKSGYEIGDFGNTSRHHDVYRRRRELNKSFDQREVIEAVDKNSVSADIGIVPASPGQLRVCQIPLRRTGQSIARVWKSSYLTSFHLRVQRIALSTRGLIADAALEALPRLRSS